MDYEKKYNNALERAKHAIEDCGDNQGRKNMIYDIFPELTESKDERIRKSIVTIVNQYARMCEKEGDPCEASLINDALAYLEKQKEQNSAELNEDHVKHEEGFKAGRESGLRDGQKYVLNNLDSYGLCKPAEWSEEDERNYKYLHQIICNYINNPQIEYKKREKASKDLISFWERLKYLRPQPKQEWSEEDKTALGDLMWCIEQARKCAKNENDLGNIWFAENWINNRVKSLRYQPHWKPSEEQMDALKYTLGEGGKFDKAALESLYEQLKKL